MFAGRGEAVIRRAGAEERFPFSREKTGNCPGRISSAEDGHGGDLKRGLSL